MSSKTPSERALKPDGKEEENDDGKKRFPNATDLNSRVRRLISAFQREFKKEEQRQAAIDKRNERRERIEQVIREREAQKIEMMQKRWSRREELDFYRTVLTFGVDYSVKDETYAWDRFRQLAKLEKKYDDTLTEYYNAFVAMCKRTVAKETKPPVEGKTDWY